MLGPSTRIYVPDGAVKVRNLRIGDQVIALDGIKMGVHTVTYVQTMLKPMDQLLKIRFEGVEKVLTCTFDTVFYQPGIGSVQVKAENLQIGQTVKGLHHGTFTVLSKESIVEEHQLKKFEKEGDLYKLYNIGLDGVLNYYLASGLLVSGLTMEQSQSEIDRMKEFNAKFE